MLSQNLKSAVHTKIQFLVATTSVQSSLISQKRIKNYVMCNRNQNNADLAKYPDNKKNHIEIIRRRHNCKF